MVQFEAASSKKYLAVVAILLIKCLYSKLRHHLKVLILTQTAVLSSNRYRKTVSSYNTLHLSFQANVHVHIHRVQAQHFLS
jgi:hypothetical protein